MISPTITTKIVEIRMATQAGQIASKKIGRASIAIAFERSKVESSKWWSYITGLIASA